MTHADLGIAVKKLHPGIYDSHPDGVVGRALQRRFPGLYDHAVDDKTGAEQGGNRGNGVDSATVPEAPKTLRIQLEQLGAGKRRVVFVARGSKLKINPAQYGAQLHRSPAGDFYFNPKLIKRAEIVAALKDHRLNEILGDVDLGYGAPPKQDLTPPVEAVVSRDGQGETVQGALTDPPHEQQSIAAADAVTPEGGTVSVEDPAKELAHRGGSPKSKKFKWRKRAGKVPSNLLSDQAHPLPGQSGTMSSIEAPAMNALAR